MRLTNPQHRAANALAQAMKASHLAARSARAAAIAYHGTFTAPVSRKTGINTLCGKVCEASRATEKCAGLVMAALPRVFRA